MPPVKPMLAKPQPRIPTGKLYEPKWDGFRSIIFRDGEEVEIGSRNERPMTRYFPEVVDAVRANFPERAVIDGDVDSGPLMISVAEWATLAGGADVVRPCLDKLRSQGRIVDHLGVAYVSFPTWTPIDLEKR